MQVTELDTNTKDVVIAQDDVIRQCKEYYYKDGQAQMGLDSMEKDPATRPEALNTLLTTLNADEKTTGLVDEAVKQGIEEYKNANGGENPDPALIASALMGAQDAIQSTIKNVGLDSMSSANIEQAAIVVGVAAVTVTNIIASALPIFAMLPNPKKSNAVPLVAISSVTADSFGGMRKGEYIDGVGGGQSYLSGHFKFALQADKDNSSGGKFVYKVQATTQYKNHDEKTLTPAPRNDEEGVFLLPFYSGNAEFRLNGLAFAHTRGDRNKSIVSGTVYAEPKKKGADAYKIKLGDKEYTFSSAKLNLDTSEIEITFDKKLPEELQVVIHLVTDFSAKKKNNDFKIDPVGTGFTVEQDVIQTYPMRNRIRINPDVARQLTNQLNLHYVPTALGKMQGKFFFENNLRLLADLIGIAKGLNYIARADLQRGVSGNMAAVANTSGDLFSEIIKYLSAGRQKIAQRSFGASKTFDLYVGNNEALYFKCLSADKFKQTGYEALGNQIVKIGVLSDGTNVYHAPALSGILDKTAMLLVGRSNVQAECPLVGTMLLPPTVTKVVNDDREEIYGIVYDMGSEVNPIERFSSQCELIYAQGMPELTKN